MENYIAQLRYKSSRRRPPCLLYGMASIIWRGRLAFGMVAIPVRLYKAARRERIRFRNVYRPEPSEEEPEEPAEFPPEPVTASAPPSGSAAPAREPRPAPEPAPEPSPPTPLAAPAPVARVHHAPVGDAAGEQVQKSQILKGYELERDRYVVLDPSEVAALRPRTSSEIEIAQFARLREIDPIYFETSYYLAPGEGGEKPFALLYRALTETGYAAIGVLAMHGREHRVVIRNGNRGLILHTLFNEVETAREEEYAASPELVAARELELAKMLVEALAAPFDPAFRDSYQERLKGLIESRVPAPAAAGPAFSTPARPPVVDIMDALRKSLQAARKPVQSETAAPPPKTAARRKQHRRAGK